MGLIYADNFKADQDIVLYHRLRFRRPHYRPSQCPPYASTRDSVSSSSRRSSCSPSSTPNSSFSFGRTSIDFLLDAKPLPLFVGFKLPLLDTPPAQNPSLPPITALEDSQSHVLRCRGCHNHICLNSLVVSDNFYGNYGPALFVSKVLNTNVGRSKNCKQMKTGRFIIKTLYCRQCRWNIGWKYVYSEEEGEKYKEGNYVIERTRLEEVED